MRVRLIDTFTMRYKSYGEWTEWTSCDLRKSGRILLATGGGQALLKHASVLLAHTSVTYPGNTMLASSKHSANPGGSEMSPPTRRVVSLPGKSRYRQACRLRGTSGPSNPFHVSCQAPRTVPVFVVLTLNVSNAGCIRDATSAAISGVGATSPLLVKWAGVHLGGICVRGVYLGYGRGSHIRACTL